MKTPTLLVKPDIARDLAEYQTSTLLGIAVIRRGVNVEPNAIHVREITTQLINHLVAFAFGAEARTFHDFEFFKLGSMLQHHIKIRVETAGGDDDGFAVNFKRGIFFGRGHAQTSLSFFKDFAGLVRSR